MQPKSSFQEMEDMCANNQAPHQKLEIQLDTINAANDDPNSAKTEKTDVAYFNRDTIQTSRKDFIEVRTFLPTKTDKMISSRYENPLTQLKSSTKLWKVLTLCLAVFSFAYFSLNLWATLSLFDMRVIAEAPRPIVEASNLLLEMQDMVFYNNTVNLVMDVWALVIYVGLAIVLLRESTAYIEKSFEEKGKFEKIVSRTRAVVVILFGLSYLAGTVFLLHSQSGAKDLINLLVFHSTKVLYLLLNVIAFRIYRTKKFVYEDLLLEALEPSDIGDDKSEGDDIEDP